MIDCSIVVRNEVVWLLCLLVKYQLALANLVRVWVLATQAVRLFKVYLKMFKHLLEYYFFANLHSLPYSYIISTFNIFSVQ